MRTDSLVEKQIVYLKSFDALTPEQAEELKFLEEQVRWQNDQPIRTSTDKKSVDGAGESA